MRTWTFSRKSDRLLNTRPPQPHPYSEPQRSPHGSPSRLRWAQIPNPLLRWALPKLLDILYPLFLKLNERFDETPFAPRCHVASREHDVLVQTLLTIIPLTYYYLLLSRPYTEGE